MLDFFDADADGDAGIRSAVDSSRLIEV